jgi:polysaccharide pyruvyl transferase WcaK-like protein
LAWIVLACLLYRCLPLAFVRRFLSRVTPWIAALESVDFAGDVRGGDSFSDIYGMRGFLDGFFAAWSVLLVKGSMVQFPQTYGPYKSFIARCLARYLLRRSRVVIARDQESQRLAQELVGPGQKVWLSPDVAFALEPVKPERIELEPGFPDRDHAAGSSAVGSTLTDSPGRIGLNVSGLMYNGGYTRNNMFGLTLDYPAFLPSLVVALLHEHPGEIWLVTHTYGRPGGVEDDRAACHQVRAVVPPVLRERVRVITGEYDCHEIKYIIGQFDFFIGSRMHACIAALSQGVPCVGVAYSKKFAGVFESVGVGASVVDARQVSNDQAIARILELFRTRHLGVKALRQRSDAARAQLSEVFQKLAMTGRPAVGLQGRQLAEVQP